MLACGNFSDTSNLKLLETKGIGHVSANAVQECGGPSWCYMHAIQLHCKAEFRDQVYVAAAYAGLTGTIRVTSPS